MKELSIEEKAKAYDEAIKRVENIKTGKCETTFMFTEGLFEYVFPELKESEDERIRKAMIDFFRDRKSRLDKMEDYLSPSDFPNEDYLLCEKAISWLEKQGEQKSAWSEEDEENFNWFEKFFRAESVVAEGKDIPQDRYLWFKNLKERVQPQNKWKPSEEQINTLEYYMHALVCNEHKEILFGLYTDLKKLREE